MTAVSHLASALERQSWRRALVWLSDLVGVDPQLLMHSSFLLVASVLGQALSFAVQMLVARQIGADAYGVYSYAFAWINLLVLLALMGKDRLLIRYGSEYRANAELALLHSLLRWSFGWSLAVSGLLMSVFAVASHILMEPSPQRLGIILWSALAVPIVAAALLTESLLRVLEAHGWASLPNRILRPFLMGSLFLLLPLLVTTRPDARWAVATNTMALLIVLVISAAALRRRLPPQAPRCVDLPRRAWHMTSAAFGVNALALFLNGQLDILVLGVFQDERVVGIYGAVSRYAVLMNFATVAVVAIIQPMIVRSVVGGSRDETERLVKGGARLVFVTNTCLALPIIVFAEPLLAIFGPAFESGATALRVLVLGAIAASMINLAGPLLGMAGYEKQATMTMVGGCCLTLLLVVLMAPRYGATGAALAVAGSRIVWNLALFLLALARTGITPAPVALPSWIRRRI
jgi:O-antigen/teichoic acid export membrane protein